MTDDISVFTAHDIPDLINALPTVFGFTPEESIVAIATSGPRHRFGVSLRMDLPPVHYVEPLAERIVTHLSQHDAEGAVIIAVTSHRTDVAGLVVGAIHERLAPIETIVAAWADGQRYWTLDGHPQGVQYQTSSHHLAVVQAVAAGQVIEPDRAALAARFDPVTGERRRWLDHAADAVMERAAGVVQRHPDADLAALAVADVGASLARALSGKGPDDGDALSLAVWVSTLTYRDQVWQAMNRDNAREHLRVWTHVAKLAPTELAPGPLCLAGFAAWLTGDGTLARIAAERAALLDPCYRLASLLLSVLDAGIPPSTWSSFGDGERESA